MISTNPAVVGKNTASDPTLRHARIPAKIDERMPCTQSREREQRAKQIYRYPPVRLKQ